MTPLLSLVVPVRNMTGKLNNLERWLDSSDLSKIEVLIVEDIDDMNTNQELNDMINRLGSAQIRLISAKFGSPGAARNAGKAIAEGKWIAFWDADDRGNPEVAVDALGNKQVNTSVDVIVFSFETRDWNSDAIISQNHVDVSDSNLDELASNPGVWRIIFKADFIKNLDFPNYRMAEDQVFLARVNNQNPRTHFVDRVLYSYFRSVPGQLTTSVSAISDLSRSIKEMNELCKNSSNGTLNFELYIRQCISGIRHGKISDKATCLLNMWRFFLINPSISKLKIVVKVVFS